MRPPSNDFGAMDDGDREQRNNGSDGSDEGPDAHVGAMMICTQMAGRAIIRVVSRCNDAQENNNLDLSECQLMQVPDAVYHLMRHTELKSCDLSGNDITKISPKFTVKFSLITDLNLAHNQLARLPDEIATLEALRRLDISYNTFIGLSNAIFRIPKLEQLNASNNHILDVEVDDIGVSPQLQELDLTNNPLTIRSYDKLSNISRVRVRISPREVEEWEDLTI